MRALPTEALITQLRQALGDAAVVTERIQRELLSTDFYAAGATCAAPAGRPRQSCSDSGR
jgi:hypothetical protein